MSETVSATVSSASSEKASAEKVSSEKTSPEKASRSKTSRDKGYWDVAVIGGGIHGAGVAQAVAAQGLSVVVLEKNQWASGTSSRSSKLVHGGLRYLQTMQFGLVRESLRERELLLRLAPELVRPQRFIIPVYRKSRYRPWQVRSGLAAYSLLSGLTPETRFRILKPAQWPDLEGLRTQDLQAVFSYRDAQTDDILLTKAVLASARELGATLLCPAELLSARRDNDQYQFSYRSGEDIHEGQCRFLVNAAGPWVEQVRQQVDPLPRGANIDLVQGSHLILAQPLARHIYYLESPRDQRAVFVMPWEENCLVGTTELLYRGDPEASAPTYDETEYLLEVMRLYFPDHPLEIIAQFAGLRVLPHSHLNPFLRDRSVQFRMDKPERSRYLAIYGGKLTTYRATGEKVAQHIVKELGHRKTGTNTATLPLTLSAARSLS